MNANVHVSLHLHGFLEPLLIEVLVTSAGPFVTLEVPAGSAPPLGIIASDPADLRALGAACQRAADALEARLRELVPVKSGEGAT